MEQLSEFKSQLKSSEMVAVEETGNDRYFVRQLSGQVHELKMVTPSQFKVIKQSIKNIDRHDAELLALFLSKRILPEIRMSEELRVQLKSLARTRDKLVLRTTLKNKVHNLINYHGIIIQREDFSNEKGLKRVLSYPVNEIAN